MKNFATISLAHATKIPKASGFILNRILTTTYNAMDIVVTKTYRYFLFMIWVFAILSFYWLVIDNHNPVKELSFTNPSFYTPVGSSIPNGLTIRKHICVSEDTIIEIHPHYNNTISMSLTPLVLSYTKGCHDNDLKLKIPLELSNDTYIYSSLYKIKINPMKTQTKSYLVGILKVINASKGVYQIQLNKTPLTTDANVPSASSLSASANN